MLRAEGLKFKKLHVLCLVEKRHLFLPATSTGVRLPNLFRTISGASDFDESSLFRRPVAGTPLEDLY
jgi:hypothetical protein